ncbi:hypothetical protein D9M71_578090 [compost metagenome]
MFGEVMHRQGAADALAEHYPRLAPNLGRLVEPGERGVDVLVKRGQAGRALGTAVAAIVQQQHLVALGRQPPTAAEVGGDIAAVAVQVQHGALHLDARFCRQPPGVQAGAVGGGQVDVAVFQLDPFRREGHVAVRIEQQRAAALQEQCEEDQQTVAHRGFLPGDPLAGPSGRLANEFAPTMNLQPHKILA